MLLNLFVQFAIFFSGIYSFNIATLNAGNVSLSASAGKKILIVNIATQSEYAQQLQELQTLYQQWQDSLTVIAFPSNSFGNEPVTDAEELRIYLENNYGITFPVSELSLVTGADAHPVYRWLGSKTDNGRISVRITGDFDKCIIDETGEVKAVFSHETGFFNPDFIEALKN